MNSDATSGAHIQMMENCSIGSMAIKPPRLLWSKAAWPGARM